MKNSIKTLINVRDLNYQGGVVQIFKTLRLDKYNNIDYFIFSEINKKHKLLFLLNRYLHFLIRIKYYDIIHINPSLSKSAIWRDIIFLLIAKYKNKKVIIFMHGWDDGYEQKIINSNVLSKLFLYYNKADAFFVLGNIFKEKLISMGISKNTKFFIETTIADDEYISGFNIEKKINKFIAEDIPIKFLLISRIVSGKGILFTIDIFNKTQKNTSHKMELTIAGDGDKLSETIQFVKDNKVENVNFTGYVKGSMKHKLFSESYFLILTSKSEGLPGVIVEGMLYGLPIITSNVGAISDWVKNNENGFITNSKNADDFVPFIKKLIKCKDLYVKIARNNHKIAKNNFTKEVITKRFLEHYKEVYDG